MSSMLFLTLASLCGIVPSPIHSTELHDRFRNNLYLLSTYYVLHIVLGSLHP